MPATSDSTTLSRRSFLIRSGWLAVGVTTLSSCTLVRSIVPTLPSIDDPELENGLSWVQALPDGRVRFFCPRMEMGQGAPLGLGQVVAEELNLDQTDIECVLPNTSQTPPFKMTVGSEGIASFFDPVSYGAAHLREALRNLAATKTGLPADQIQDGKGGFVLPDGSELGYARVVPSEPLILPVSGAPASGETVPRYTVQCRGKYQAIGRNWRHHELQAIVTGETVYSRDVTLPGMLYGQIVRPPAFGARLQSADGRVAEAMADVAAVVIDTANDFVGVVTGDPFILSESIAAIDLRWELPKGPDQDQIDATLDVEQLRAEDDFEHMLAADGSVEAGRDNARHRVAARYDTPFAAHAAMEPRASVAWVKNDKVEVWCGSQDPFFVQRRVAKAIGREEGDVVVHPHRMGGGFGGRIPCRASEEAALLSAEVSRPVRVQWDREAEFQCNYFQPGFSHFIDAGVTPEGTISHWEHEFVSAPIMTGPMPEDIAWVVDQVMADEGTARGGLPRYRMANRRIRYSDIRTAVPVGAWRGLGSAPNTFAIESMIDELAIAAGIDALEFRLRILPPTDEILIGVLHRVAETSEWSVPTLPDTGRGIACAVYKDETAVAIVAEVRIDHAARQLQVSNIWCAQDCGLVVNPRQVEAQIVGNVIWGCSMALKERISFEAGATVQSNFDSYEILRNHEAPEVNVALVSRPDTAPAAVGESAFAPVPAAIANAVFAATGHRARRLPMHYDSIYSDANG